MPIPAELREYGQFVLWRYEFVDGSDKPTKVPYCPHTGRYANVLDPATWGTYAQCCEVGELGHFDGLGFVLTSNDPFAFIDLDQTSDPESQQRQLTIFNEFASYAERSPSGNGLHIIVKGHVPQGRKRSQIEVYSDKRFMTMTGWTFRDAPIADYHELLNLLWSQMAPPGVRKGSDINEPQLEADEAIYDKAARAANGEKFLALWNGDWQRYYPSQSEADFALVNILAFYTHNRDQIVRMFRLSALGQRDKAARDDYLGWMLNRTFDRLLPPVDVDAIRQQIADAIAQQKDGVEQAIEKATPRVEQHTQQVAQANTTTRPPGLLGDIADYVFSAAPRPIEKVALAAAIGLMAGVCGRAYNISGTGLNHYIIVLAGTGVGKEGLSSGIDKLMAAVTSIGDEGGGVPAAMSFIGPSEISSPQALQKHLVSKSPSFVSIVGEIGLKLRTMCEPRAPAHLAGLRRAFLLLFSKSGKGQVLGSLIYSDKEKTTDSMTAPAFSMLGESVPERFFEYLDETTIAEGFLPRFTTIEYTGKRPRLNKQHAHIRPSASLAQRLGQLCHHAMTINQAGEAVDVNLDASAEMMLDQFNEFCDDQINGDASKEINKQFWNRAHLKSLKLAALIAVGINPYAPLITPDVAQWAINFVVADVENMLAHFESGDVGADNHDSKQVDEVKRMARLYVTSPWEKVAPNGGSAPLQGMGVIPHSFFSRRLLKSPAFRKDRAGATRALHKTLTTLVDSGVLGTLGPMECKQFIENGWMKASNAKYYRLIEMPENE